jgi:hypothetical protein
MANPLTLVMPLKPGVDLSGLAEALAGAADRIDAALSKIGTVHFARFVLFDTSTPNLQVSQTAPSTGPFKLAVITEYDNDFDDYIQDFVNNIGDIFDMLLGFTEDGHTLVPVAKNVVAFKKYVAQNDASQHLPPHQSPLYSAYPQTVQKIKAKFPPPPPSAASAD